jgi:hypothetical protein
MVAIPKSRIKKSQYDSKFWKNRRNCELYMQWLANISNIETPENWYNIKEDLFLENDGSKLLECHNNLISNVLKDLYPEYDWLPWRFDDHPETLWDDIKMVRKFFDWMKNCMQLKDDIDWWHYITAKDIDRCGGKKILENYGSIHRALHVIQLIRLILNPIQYNH